MNPCLKTSLAVLIILCQASCLGTDTFVCDEGRCPSGTECRLLVDGSQGCVQLGVCGNRFIDEGETCDDGNDQSGDGCDAECRSDETCGNGYVDEHVGEACDCGQGQAVPGQACLGRRNSDQGGLCRLDCRLHCGDGELAPEESCEGGLVRTGFSCLGFGFDFGHMRCAPGCGGLDTSDCGAFDWRTMATPTSLRVRDLWGSAADNIHAVGTFGLLLHFDGSAWRQLDSPTDARLRGIWGRGPDDIFAVGDLGTVLHYDGTAWTLMPPPTSENLFTVWGLGDDLFAIGESGTILHHDGQGWQTMPSPVVTTLRDIWGTAPDDLYIAGSFGTLLHYDGQRWQTMTSPTLETLHGIWGSGPDGALYAVGDSGTFLVHDGRDWLAMTAGTSEDLLAVWGDAADDLYAVGTRGAVLHFDGAAWQPVPSPVSGDLDSVWGGPGDVFAVGENGALLHLDRVEWRAMDGNTTRWLRDVWGSAAGDVFIVGDSGTILHHDGSDWASMSPPTSSDLRGVWGSAPNNVYAVGECGTVLRYDGSGWNPLSVPSSRDLYAVWGSAANDVFIAGDRGALLHFDGATWRAMNSPTDQPLHDIWGSGPDNAFAVGETGTLLHYDGNAWTWVDARTSEQLYGVWGSGPDNVFVVGENRTVLHHDGASWRAIPPAPPTDWLRGVFGSGPTDVFAVGETGTVLHYDGASWAPLRSGTDADLYAVWAAPSGHAFVAGREGTIYQFRRNGPAARVDTTCGDGVLEYGEQCDDANTQPGDGCDASCRRESICGDGVIEYGEQCDDGNTQPDDGCNSGCWVESVSESEPNQAAGSGPGGSATEGNDFDAAAADGPYSEDTIIAAALAPAGDEDIFAISNRASGAATVRVSTYNADFGLGVPCNASIDTALHIRDAQGNSLAYDDNRGEDRCSSADVLMPAGQTVYAHVSEFGDDAIVPAYWLDIEFLSLCGDGVVQALEECEPDSPTSGPECDADCRIIATCGDGLLDAREPCDDGDNVSGDGCSSACALELPPATDIPPPGQTIGFAGALGPDDWRWARPNVGCGATWPADHYLDVIPLFNATGSDQRITVTADWIDADGHLHAYTDPLDPTGVSGCIAGNDEYASFGSRLLDLPMAAGQTVHIMASTFAGDATIDSYTIAVRTQPVDQCALP